MADKRQAELAELEITGMTCADCAIHVKRAIEGVVGVEMVVVPGWRSRRAEVSLSADTPSDALTDAVGSAGYGATVTLRRSSGKTVPEGRKPAKASRMIDRYDLVVLGSGGAGMAAAIRAAETEHHVAVVDSGTVGGTCVNVGCVPSKLLVHAAEAYRRAASHGFDGVRTKAEGLDWKRLLALKDVMVEGLRKEKYLDVLASFGDSIALIRAKGRLQADGNVLLGDGRVLETRKTVLATGASPRILPLRGIEGVPVLTSTTLMTMDRLPESLLIIGGRAVALELGQTVRRFGVQVTVLQRSASLIPDHEPELSQSIEGCLVEEGVVVHSGVHPTAVRRDGRGTVVTAVTNGKEKEYRAERLLMAVGRRATTEGLGLSSAGVEVDEEGFVIVDDRMQTTNPKIYAAGDVSNIPKLVYVAAAAGRTAAANALDDGGLPLSLSPLPRVIFTDPQVASVGLSVRDARSAGYNVKSTVLPLDHVPKAIVARKTAGLIKLVVDADSHILLGGHVVAPEGGEMIQTLTFAVKLRMRVDELVGTLFPYLTMSEGIRLAAQTFDRDLSRLSCCAG